VLTLIQMQLSKKRVHYWEGVRLWTEKKQN
jgi:hypothetical protein